MNDSASLTQWLNDWVGGDAEAFDRIAPVVYRELRDIAGQVFRREYGPHTLQPTALVHEAYERLFGADVELVDRQHFYALAARLMRHLLINHARARNAARRGGGALRVTLRESLLEGPDQLELLALDAALDRLGERDGRKAQIIELNVFGGLSQAAIAGFLGISESTVRREQRVAELWLKKYMGDGVGDGERA